MSYDISREVSDLLVSSDTIENIELASRAIFELEKCLKIEGGTKHPLWRLAFEARVRIGNIEHQSLIQRGVRSP